MSEQKVVSMFKQKVPRHLNQTIYKQMEALNENKELVYKYLIFLLYLMCNIDETDEYNRDTYTAIFLDFSDYSLPLLYGYEAVGILRSTNIRSRLLTNFISSKSTVCSKTEVKIHVFIYNTYTNATSGISRVSTTKKEFDEMMKNCTLVDESNDLKIVKIGIKYYKNTIVPDQTFLNGKISGSHANTLIIKGKDVYRIEPNIDTSDSNEMREYLNWTFATNGKDLEKEGVSIKTIFKLFKHKVKVKGFQKGKYEVEGTNLFLYDYVNYALFKFFEGTDYNFKGFNTNIVNKCSGNHGGMCVQISSILSVVDLLDFDKLKYYTVKFCQNLLEQISGTQFVIPSFIDRVLYIRNFIDLLSAQIHKSYPGTFIPEILIGSDAYDNNTERSQLEENTDDTFLLNSEIERDKEVRLSIDIALNRFNFKDIFKNLFYNFLKILEKSKWQLPMSVQDAETEEKMLKQFVGFGKINTLTRDIQYLLQK
jgi:hypothetical protein